MNNFLKKAYKYAKKAYTDIFLYPKEKIVNSGDAEYDEYWKERRGSNFILSEWQKIRADMIKNIIERECQGRPISLGDIGCGDGAVLKYLSDRLNLSFAIGYDNSDFALDKAVKVGLEILKIDLKDNSTLNKIKQTDYVLMLEVLEHLEKPENLLREAVFKASRGIFFSVPNSGYFSYRLRLFFGRFPAQWINSPDEHLRFWTLKDLKWWLNAQDYKNYSLICYKGVPFLNKEWPALFARGIIIFIKKSYDE